MIAYVILGIALLIGCYLVARWFVVAEPRQVLRIARVVLFIVAILFAGVLIFAGRHALAVLALPALIPFLINLRAMLRRARSAAGPSPGQTSEIATRFFKMRLDHDSGTMSGAILEGRFQGRMLEELSLEQLIERVDGPYLDAEVFAAKARALLNGERTLYKYSSLESVVTLDRHIASRARRASTFCKSRLNRGPI